MDTVNSLKKEVLEDISYSLDRFCFKQRKEYWRLLIDLPLLPKELYRYNKIDVEKLAFEGTKKRSPSMKLLQDFQSKHMELAYFKSLLKAVGCQDALDCFQEPSKHYVYCESCCECWLNSCIGFIVGQATTTISCIVGNILLSMMGALRFMVVQYCFISSVTDTGGCNGFS